MAIALGGGAAVFLAGEALHLWALKLPKPREHLLFAALCAATIPLGCGVSAAAQLGALVALFSAMLVREELATAGAPA